MPTLTLSYKGFSLPVELKINSFYARTEVEPGKTIYQILFEHLVDRKTISLSGLCRRYKEANEFISSGSLVYALRKIEAAKKVSSNPKIKLMVFKRLKRGEGNPVSARYSKMGRFSQEQKEIVMKAIELLHSRVKEPGNERLRQECLRALAKHGLAANVVLGDSTIIRYKRKLGIPPLSPKRRFRRR